MEQSLKTELSLQTIAATSVAISLWNHIGDIPNADWEEPIDDTDALKDIHFDVNQLVEQISLPKSVKKLIEEYVEKIYEEIKAWMSYHCLTLYFDSPIQSYHLISNFPYFIWYHDCTINYKQTARNLQNSIFLTETEKFRFLCLYCLKDEIEQKWKLLVQNRAIGSVSFDSYYPLVHYWRYYCQNRLQDVPVNQGLSIDEEMFRNDQVNNWTAKEYFFDRMNVDEQIQNTIWIIDELPEVEYQKLAIMKLNQSQRFALYGSRSTEIILNYTENTKYINEILPLWLEMSEIITEEDFIKLLKRLFTRDQANHIVAQIWISAPDNLKLRILNSENEEFILKVWNLWTKYYDDSFRMFLEMSSSIRTEILKTEMFSDHCKLLLEKGKVSMLERVLRFCFPKDEKLVSIKRQLSLFEFFTERLMDIMRNNEVEALLQSFNFFSDVIDLYKFKQDFINETSFNNYCEKLIQNGRIPDLDKLLNFFSTPEHTKESWRDFFGINFFISRSEDLIFSNKASVLDEFLNFFHFTAEESTQFKRDLVRKKFFSIHCQELINQGELSKLEEVLKSLFPCVDELVRFKEVLSRKKFVFDHCESLIRSERSTELDKLSSFLLPNDDKSLEFKRIFTTKKFFDDLCEDLIRWERFFKLETLLKSFYPNAEELVQFKQRLTRKKTFLDYCASLITGNRLERLERLLKSCLFSSVEDVAQFKQHFVENEMIDVCLNLIDQHRLPTLNKSFKLFFPSIRKATSFKKILLGNDSFNHHCETLINDSWFPTLHELLEWGFPNKRDLNQFKNQLAESNYFKKRCLRLYTTENFEELNHLLSSLFLPRSKLIYEIKRNLLFSEEGFEILIKLADKSKTVLDDFITDFLSTSSADFKKKIIFSPVAISHLKKLMLKNILSDVKICLNQFLDSTADKKALKMKLLDNAVEFFAMLFFKSDKSACQSNIKWWLPDKASIEECKQKLSIDEVFEAGIRTCIFKTFDRYGRISRCTFKKDFNFEALDRFLKWYFESSKEIKEFKIRKIRDYENMKTISVVLKNSCRYSYFKQILEWFFENDAVEMAKFKKKHKGEKFANMINFV